MGKINFKNMKLFDVINFLIGLLSLIVGIISLLLSVRLNNEIYFFVFKISCFLFFVLVFLNLIKDIFLHLYMIDGTFAVSAIVINDDEQFLLVEENINGKIRLSQPSSYYRLKNKYTRRQYNKLENNKLLSPYEQIVNVISKEAGISKASLELIDFSLYKEISENLKKITVEELLLNKKYRNLNLNNFKEYDGNEFSPAPFLVEKEICKSKFSSKETIHVDLFYAFKISQFNPCNSNINFFDYDEFCNRINDDITNIYSDLIFVVDYFRTLYHRTKKLEKEIRFCRINQEKYTIIWEITNNCNQYCKFCINGHNKSHNRIEISQDNINNIFEMLELVLDISKEYKIILTGGEPSLIENLLEIIEFLNEKNYIKEISICTNGIHNSSFMSALDVLEKKTKIVVNLPAYDYDTYAKITCGRSKKLFKDYTSLTGFVKRLGDLNINFCLVTVMTNIFNNPDYTRAYIFFLRKNKVKDISFSYIVKTGENIDNKNLFFDKMDDVLQFYNNFIGGIYGDVSFLKSCKLMLPNCENKYCNENNNVIFIKDNNVVRKCIYKM